MGGLSREKNTWEPALAIQHIWRLLITFYKENPGKSTGTLIPYDSILLMTKPIINSFLEPSAVKQKRGRSAKASSTNKQSKKN